MAVRNDFTAGEVLAAADLNDTFASKLDLAGGKILQIVRATDTTQRSTTSTSLVDASISVTITPQKDDSAIFLVWVFRGSSPNNQFLNAAITDNSNNPISGAEDSSSGVTSGNSLNVQVVIIGYSTPATISATTYKGRFRSTTAATATLQNQALTGQLLAIEVSA